ncbi:AP-4 complex subunit epsilon [Tetrabaena socialis]|uniref:AP-4 complex subunit epsilon n=1 Tax=Tetrabaena socialis TaxID=47790 RepID=A0A2J8A5L3_9CHLO|nr:AP-4 complex subunit epsilon [Tetrabaena socialis]|eukprot:PNH07811.1 AP-4 complex subunit epsilon [Tetrabaena socialis]
MQSKLEKVVAGLKTGPRFLKELREFDNLVKAIGECKSKAEEDRIIVAELELLKVRLSDPKLDKSRGKEYMIRLIYCEMLGHDASFAYIKALQFASDPNIHTKKAAYLALTQFMDYDNQLVLLLVNTLLSDLKSDNYLIGVGSPSVAVSAHGRADPRLYGGWAPHDPAVMSAALCALHDCVKTDPRSYKNLISSFTSILKQVGRRVAGRVSGRGGGGEVHSREERRVKWGRCCLVTTPQPMGMGGGMAQGQLMGGVPNGGGGGMLQQGGGMYGMGPYGGGAGGPMVMPPPQMLQGMPPGMLGGPPPHQQQQPHQMGGHAYGAHPAQQQQPWQVQQQQAMGQQPRPAVPVQQQQQGARPGGADPFGDLLG